MSDQHPSDVTPEQAEEAVRVLLRHHELSRRGPTGRYTDEVVATWQLG